MRDIGPRTGGIEDANQHARELTAPHPARVGTMSRSVIVVGGGISGHTAAFRLHQRGAGVTVLDASPDTVGGEMSSVRREGYVFNQASTLIPSSYTQITGLMQELGIGDKLHGTVGAVTSIPREGRMNRMRVSGAAALIDGLTTPLLSLGAKLALRRFGADVVRHGRGLGYADVAAELDEESVAQYAQRRLTPEIMAYLVGPLLRAAYLTEPENLSVLDLLFAVSKFAGDRFVRYDGGMGALNEAIAARLGTIMGARAIAVEERGAGVQVTWHKDGVERTSEADACVIAVPAPLAAELAPQLDPALREILAKRIPYGSVIKASHALHKRSDDPTTMMSFPHAESAGLAVITFDHNYRVNCAPEGKGLIASYWMHDWSVQRMDPEMYDDAAIEREMTPEIARFIPGFEHNLAFSHISRWPRATPVSYAGMWKQVRIFRESVPANARIQFAGDYLNIPGTKAASYSGERAAKRIISWLGL